MRNDNTLRPSELAATLALLVEARQPAMVWGPPGSAQSMIAQQVAADGGREYVDVRALLLDPVDLRGIPWRDAADRSRVSAGAVATIRLLMLTGCRRNKILPCARITLILVARRCPEERQEQFFVRAEGAR